MMDALIPVISEKFADRLADKILVRFSKEWLPGLRHRDYDHGIIMDVLRKVFTVTEEE